MTTPTDDRAGQDNKDFERWQAIGEWVNGPDSLGTEPPLYLKRIATAESELLAQQIATEHNEHEALQERVRELESAIMCLGMYDPKMAGGSRLVNGKTWLEVWALLNEKPTP